MRESEFYNQPESSQGFAKRLYSRHERELSLQCNWLLHTRCTGFCILQKWSLYSFIYFIYSKLGNLFHVCLLNLAAISVWFLLEINKPVCYCQSLPPLK